jgi:hypothetical protein
LLAVTVLLFLAIGGPWWQTELTATSPDTSAVVQNVVVVVHLGGGISCSTYQWFANNPCLNVSSRQNGTLASVYSGMNYALFGLVGASGLAWLLATLGNFGVRFGRRQLTAEIVLVVAVVFAALGLLVTSAVLGPGPQSGAVCWTLSGDVASCPSFWGRSVAGAIPGGCLTCYNELSWGGALGYYEALAATAVGGLTAVGLWQSRGRPYTAEEVAAWAAKNAPLPLRPQGSGSGTPGSPGDAVSPVARMDRPEPPGGYPGFRVPETDWTCPKCGSHNSRFALQCGVCHTVRSDR